MNNSTEIKMEILIVSRYCEIIMQLLGVHKQLSINKTVFFSFLLKEQSNYYKQVFNSNTEKDIVIKAISLIAGRYNDYCQHIKYIIEAIHLLIMNNSIYTIDSNLFLNQQINYCKSYENKFIQKAIEKSKNISDRQFLKEVINNV